jgi:phage terminase Nu1 subunit (DNA packaging protein)
VNSTLFDVLAVRRILPDMVRKDANATVTTNQLGRLFGVTPKVIAKLAKRKIIEKSEKRGSWLLQPSVTAYCEHLRVDAAVRGGQAAEARAKLSEAQAELANTRAAKMRGELVDASDVEKLWISKLRALRNRILGIPSKVQYLSARQTVVLTQELRDVLDELADDGP